MHSVILLVMLALLPYLILKDSKERFGKYSWKWATISFLTYAAVIGPIGSRDLNVGSFLGGLIAPWAGLFGFYRARKTYKAKKLSHSKTHDEETREDTASGAETFTGVHSFSKAKDLVINFVIRVMRLLFFLGGIAVLSYSGIFALTCIISISAYPEKMNTVIGCGITVTIILVGLGIFFVWLARKLRVAYLDKTKDRTIPFHTKKVLDQVILPTSLFITLTLHKF